MEITQKIRDAIPEEYRDKTVVIFWNKNVNRFYAYRVLGNIYDPKKKRGREIKETLGSISPDGVFRKSRLFKEREKVSELQVELKKKNDRPDPTLGNAAGRSEALEAVTMAAKTVEDPRLDKKVSYSLDALLAVAMLSSLSGATSAVSIAIYWKRFHHELSLLIDGLPEEDISHDTVNRVLRLVKPDRMLSLLDIMTASLFRQYAVRFIHVDGQSVRASKSADCSDGRYIFNVYDSTSGILLTHQLIDKKENEISVAADVLSSLDLRSGDIITADALNTQRRLVSVVDAAGADYCLAVKGNHRKLHAEIRYLFNSNGKTGILSSIQGDVECDHGRIERRSYDIMPATFLSEQFREGWAGLNDGCILRAVTESVEKATGEVRAKQERYFISSLNPKAPGIVNILATAVRRHWRIENNLHWELDVQYGQDRIQASDGNYLSNRSLLNKIALSVLHAAAESYRIKNGSRFSIKTLQQLCSTPMGALDTLAMALDLQKLLKDVKV